MNLEQITLKGAAADPASGARPLALALGKGLVARVLAAPEGGGRGLISLAGIVLEARVPAGLEAGRALRLQVTRADAEEIVVRIVSDASEHLDGAAAGRVAGGSPCAGDPDLLRAALALADGARCGCPGAAADRDRRPGRPRRGTGIGPAAGGEAAFMLHCPHAGAIEVRLHVGPGGVRAGVVDAAGPGLGAGRVGALRSRRRARAGDGPPGHRRRPRPAGGGARRPGRPREVR